MEPRPLDITLTVKCDSFCTLHIWSQQLKIFYLQPLIVINNALSGNIDTLVEVLNTQQNTIYLQTICGI